MFRIHDPAHHRTCEGLAICGNRRAKHSEIAQGKACSVADAHNKIATSQAKSLVRIVWELHDSRVFPQRHKRLQSGVSQYAWSETAPAVSCEVKQRPLPRRAVQ